MNTVFNVATVEEVLMIVDSGKMNSKAYGKAIDGTEITSIFRTNVVATDKIAHLDFKVSYRDTVYSVGDANHAVDPDHLKTEKNISMHVISTLKAITDLIEAGKYPRQGLKIALGVNMPIKQYLQPELRPTFQNLYRGVHKITVADREYSFEVTSVDVFPEGLGVLYLNAGKYKGKKFVICDNGGLNSSFVLVDNLRPTSGSDSLQTGVHTLCVEIAKRLSHRGLKHEQIIDILENNGKTHSDEEIDGVVAECLKAHVKAIYTALDSVSRAVLTDYCFTGGASSIYEKELRNYFPHVEFSEGGVFDNAKGFYRRLESIKRKKNQAQG